MKKIKYILVSVFALFFYTDCDEVEKLLEEDVEIPIAFQGILEIESPQTGNPEEEVEVASEFAYYNILNDPEVMELLESGGGTGDVKKIEVTQIRYLFQEVEGNFNANVTGFFQVIDASMATETFETVQTNLAVADENNSLFIIDGDFTSLNSHLTDTGALSIRFVGSVSDNPVDFNIDITVLVTVTITPSEL